MIKLYNAGTNALLGEITDAQLAFLQEQFEEEWSGDQDYFLNRATLDMLEEAGADPELVTLLGRALVPTTRAIFAGLPTKHGRCECYSLIRERFDRLPGGTSAKLNGRRLLSSGELASD